jgi:hypothetical protein
MKCDRCGAYVVAYITSMFNTDTICMRCKTKEQAHPAYEAAREAEMKAVMGGDTNFPGVGCPPELYRREDVG